MLPNFVAKIAVGRRNCLLLNGRPAIEQFEELRTHLVSSLSRDAAMLFGEPVITQKGDNLDVAWYAEQAGRPIPIDALDPDAQGLVINRLKVRLEAIVPLLSGPSGALLSRALYVFDAASIMAVNQEPLLIQWGLVPDAVNAAAQATLDAHFSQTLGRYMSGPPPVITAATRRIASADSSETPVAPIQVTARAPDQRPVGLFVATAIVALLALLFTLPSFLAAPSLGQNDESAALADARKITKAMRDKLEMARSALARAECDPDGNVVTPEGKDHLPLSPLPVRGAEGGVEGDMALVARRAVESVVFVFTCTDKQTWDERHKADKEKGAPVDCPKIDNASPGTPQANGSDDGLVVLGSGSGFFVAPKTIVTNFHVVRQAKAVFVTNRFLGRARRATVVTATPPGTSFQSPDFALLALPLDQSPKPIELSTVPALLQNVVAAGYPGVVLSEDVEREKLFLGDPTAVPSLTTFPGSVTLIKFPDQPMQLIYSSATIGHGNSGGPLLDVCARAIGMNTFGWSGTEGDSAYKVNIAEGAKALSAFLNENHVAHTASAQTCQPGVQAKLDPSPAHAPPTPPSGPVK